MIRRNVFESIRMREEFGAEGVHTSVGVYLDDQGSNFAVYNNSFKDVQSAVLINGGRRNTVKFNTFVNCDLAVFFRDAGEGCWPDGCGDTQIFQRMRQMPYADGTWAVRYPEMTNFAADYPGLPVYTEIVGNRYCGNSSFMNDCNACGLPDPRSAHGPCPANESSVVVPCEEKMARVYLSTVADNSEDPALEGCSQ